MNKKNITQLITYAALITAYFNTTEASGSYHQDQTEKPYYMAADYLFWKAQADQTYYAIKVPGGITDAFLLSPEIDLVEQCFKNNSGVRLKAGYSFCDNWDTRLTWTHLNSCSLSSVQEPNGIVATAIFQLINQLGGSGAQSIWNTKFNTVDWEFGTTRDLYETVTFRPHVGIKWGKINQNQNISYTGIAGISEALVKKHNGFSGVGPRAGIDSQWYFCDNFSLLGNISGALVYGKFNVHADYTLADSQSLQIFKTKIVDCKKRLVPMAQMLLGLNWETSCSCAAFDVGIGYEAQYWWNQWQSIPSVVGMIATTPGHGDFTTHGLIASLIARF